MMPARRLQSRWAKSSLDEYFHEISLTPLLTAAEERELATRVAEGDKEARDRMIRANLRLVVNVARCYSNPDLSLEDLIEEGNLGLLKAVERYDLSRNCRFSTYAVFWIKQSIRRTLANTGRTIRLPAYLADLLRKWQRAVTQLQSEWGRTPSDEEVGDYLNLTKAKRRIVKQALNAHCVASRPGDADDGWGLEETIVDQRPSVDSETDDAEDWQRVQALLGRLKQREAHVLRLRFGLDEHGPKTLKEVGQQMGVTRERVRQIEKQALDKLRHVARVAV